MWGHAEHKVMLSTLEYCTHKNTHNYGQMLGFEFSMAVNIRICIVVFIVVTLCSVTLFPEDKGGWSSKTMVTILIGLDDCA